MSTSMREALNKANVQKDDLKKEFEPYKVPFYLKPPYVSIGEEYKYDHDRYGGFWNKSDDQPTDNKNIQLMLASNSNRLYFIPKSICQSCCNIWIAYNSKFDRFTIRGEPYFKLKNVPVFILKNAQMRRIMDNYKITLDFSLLDIIRTIDRKGMEQLINVLFGESQNPIIVEIED